MKPIFQSKWISSVTLVIAMLVWGSSFIALKIALHTMGPMSIIFGRMLVASLCFLFFLKQFSRLSFTRSDLKYILLMVIFEPCFYYIFEIKALQFTSASQAGVITSTMPLITAIFAGIFLGEMITRKLIFGSVLAMAGAMWLSLEASADLHAPNPLLGNFLEFLAMVCGTGYTLSVKYLTKKFKPLFLTAIQSFAGVIFYLPLAIWESKAGIPPIETNAIYAILYLGIVVTLGGYGLYNFSLTKIPASKAAIFVNLIPIFAILFAFIILGERFTFFQLVASGIILLGVLTSKISDSKD